MVSQRMEKVQKLARQVLGEEIQGLKDPRIGFATVTSVKITPDLRHARVLVSVLGTAEEASETMKGLKSARPHLRVELGRQMRMKYLPELEFELDTGAEEALRLEEILNKIKSDRPAEDEPDQGPHAQDDTDGVDPAAVDPAAVDPDEVGTDEGGTDEGRADSGDPR